MLKILFLSLVFLLVACTTTSPTLQNIAAANVNVQLGLAYLERGDTTRAKSKLLLALAQNPTNDVVQDAMGYFCEKTGDSKNAEKYYLQAVANARHKGAAYNNYGAFLYRQKKYREALQYFTLATKDPYYLHTEMAQKNAVLVQKKITSP